LLVVNPARPLFPTNVLTSMLRRFHAPASLVDRADRVYSVYRHRYDALAPARRLTPADARTIGMVTYDDPETSMWRPYGSRRVVHVRIDDSPEYLRTQGVRYIWVNLQAVAMLSRVPFEKWVGQMNGRERLDLGLDLRAGQP